MQRVLVANRGEIACRILRSIQQTGLSSVAVFSDADTNAPHVALADQAVRLGPASAQASYMNITALLEAAVETGADAIHPGYGFLSENADFAQQVEQAGLTFIGPSAQAIRDMGDKATARQIMAKAGVPCVAGYDGQDQSDPAFAQAAATIGYPVMIKAAAGGGGHGMRLVDRAQDLQSALDITRSEARAGFGSAKLILEKAIKGARHIEFQVFGDRFGKILHLGERDCSLQRRHQKIIEEAPAPGLSPELRDQMGAIAVKAAQAVDYVGAGTVEFLLDANGNFYFLEMNTRLQVEHPVTECVTGLDLVALQLDVAVGKPLGFHQSDITISGHAIQARLYAEDPSDCFLPQTGPVKRWVPSCNARIRHDAGITEGAVVSPHYDPMLAKIIATGDTREAARRQLRTALSQTVLLGLPTNTRFLGTLLDHPAFVEGTTSTDLVDAMDPPDLPQPSVRTVCILAALILTAQRDAMRVRAPVAPSHLGWSSAALPQIPVNLDVSGTQWNLSALAVGPGWEITHDGARHFIDILAQDRLRCDGAQMTVVFDVATSGEVWIAEDLNRFCAHLAEVGEVSDKANHGNQINAPMPGKLTEIFVRAGATVSRGDQIAVIEAMKMQHKITAPQSGTIESLHVSKGTQLGKGDLIATLAPVPSGET